MSGPRQSLYFVEQDRLTYPAQPGEEHALLGPLRLDPAKENAGLLEDRVTSHEFRGRRTSTGRKRVPDRVHA